jgi:hypothetical protein
MTLERTVSSRVLPGRAARTRVGPTRCEVERPWASDDELLDFLGRDTEPRFDASLDALEELAAARPDVADRYRGYLRQSAVRWLDNLAWVASGQDRTFESRLATRLAVEPRGTLLLMPESFSVNMSLSMVYADIVGAVGAVFPTVATAAGAHPLDRCR